MRAITRGRAELGRIKRIFVGEASLKEWVGFRGEEIWGGVEERGIC